MSDSALTHGFLAEAKVSSGPESPTATDATPPPEFAPRSAPDPEFDRTILAQWRQEGAPLVERNAREFSLLLDDIRRALDRKNYPAAAAAAAVAATFAVFWHTGAFHSPTLEACLHELGEKTMRADGSARAASAQGPLRILHVATQAGAIGGHVRMLRRWIRQDADNIHSVAFTRQYGDLAPDLEAAVEATGGAVHLLNQRPGSYLAWARGLQRLMGGADLVILHTHSMDIIPFIALGGMRHPPRTLLLDHADHIFWLGAGTVDAVISTRHSGRDLCIRRRGVPADQVFLLPLCLERITRAQSRQNARRALGIAPEATVILSIARAIKYRRVGSRAYADLVLPVLRKDASIKLIVIGPGTSVDWSEASAEVPGQIISLPETPETRRYLDAADIYLDSFPFPSNTSLFEAGLTGLPLVSFFPFGLGCDVMGADSIGFDTSILRAQSADELTAILSELITDPGRRTRIGDQTRRGIEKVNFGAGWKKEIASIYASVERRPHPANAKPPEQSCALEDIDLFQPFTFGHSTFGSTHENRLTLVRYLEIKALPFRQRAGLCLSLAADRQNPRANHAELVKCMLPEWLSRSIRSHLGKLGRVVAER